MTSFRTAEQQKFLALFPDIVTEIVSSPKWANVPEIAARVKELLEYNSLGGEKTRGLMTVHAYRVLANPETITEDSMRLAHILGWCVELYQTSLFLMDDLIDNSTTRRGQLCWYRRPGVGLIAINDSFLMITLMYDLLREHLSGKACYADMKHVFNETLRHVCIGQYPVQISSGNYDKFTVENYKKLSNYKITYYTFKLPLCISLLLAGKPYEDAFDKSEDIVTDMGILYSMQNDFNDCFGAEKVLGKAGNDIQQGTCTWLAVTALERCSAEQRALFTANYGSADEERVQRIKQLYEALELPEYCREALKALHDSIVNRLKGLPDDNVIPSTLLLDLLEMIVHMKMD